MVLWIHVGEEVVAEVNVLLGVWVEFFHSVCFSVLLLMPLWGRFGLWFGLWLGLGAKVSDLRVLVQLELPFKPTQVVVLNWGLLKKELSGSRHLLTDLFRSYSPWRVESAKVCVDFKVSNFLVQLIELWRVWSPGSFIQRESLALCLADVRLLVLLQRLNFWAQKIEFLERCKLQFFVQFLRNFVILRNF